jgi:Holliday junction DNA helicase RuvB
MENFKLSFIYSSEENSKPLEIPLPRFTLVAATTMVYKISTPLRNRFPIQIKLEDYSLESVEKMTEKMFQKMRISITKEAIFLVAKSSRKNPRILKNNCKRILDYAIYKKLQNIDIYEVLEVLKQLKIYDDGLNIIDIEIMKSMQNKFNNRPISLDTIALVIGESKHDIVTIHEPYLVENGYIIRTKRGRILSTKAIEYLKKIDEISTYYSSKIAFVIGGSFGVSDEVKKRADYKISFSKMTFPHQLAKGILLEQIYRSFKILKNESYHK